MNIIDGVIMIEWNINDIEAKDKGKCRDNDAFGCCNE